MKYTYYILLVLLIFSSCKEKSEKEPETEKTETTPDGESLKNYSSPDFQLRFEYPDNYKVIEDSLPGKAPVINVFRKNNPGEPPFVIHEDFGNAYISFLPRGYGVDGPSGVQKSLEEFGNPLPLSFEIDKQKSRVYLLNNGELWGLYLRFATPPETWSEYGGIFVRYKVRDFEARCKSSANKEIPMEECDPLGGDEILYFGKVEEKSKQEIDGIIKSLWFSRDNYDRKEISDLIKIELAVRGKTIESPLEIKGEARGNWFFEATAPVELLDGNFRSLGRSYIEVVGSNWMTEEFVAFKGSIDFKKPDTENGYLLLKNGNASGKPELDRILRIPVKF
ncbi:Gmad2 immunoglobulin-like domain-containing protein [Salegentibacter sediminis]|uniref:Gmad2 immunoglobulin-like domain-containing protein n=1 Tax=Salegentibacter sediminis TaxID=1930251 RepID=UPI0012FF72CD|nr:Gmad2 immunoglobulin-like domain-containing protein [Salegentibacter sediminis]